MAVEAGIRPVQLLEPYYANHDVRCAFCAHRQVHKKGYLALLPDGRRALCGNVCAKEYFDKQTVNSLDRKRDQLASARLRRKHADAIIGNASALLPLIDEDIAQNEWEAEASMSDLGLHLNAAVREQIKRSDVLGVQVLGQRCRAFGDARGGLALIVGKASGVTEREAEKQMDKRRIILRRQAGTVGGGSPYYQNCKVVMPEVEAPDRDTIMATLGWWVARTSEREFFVFDLFKGIKVRRSIRRRFGLECFFGGCFG